MFQCLNTLQPPPRDPNCRPPNGDPIDNCAPLPWGQVAQLINQPSATFEQGVKSAIALAVEPLQLMGIELWLYQPEHLRICSSQADRDRTISLSNLDYASAVQWLTGQHLLTLASLSQAPALMPLAEADGLPQAGALLFVAVTEGDRSVGGLWLHRSGESAWSERDRVFAQYLAEMVQMAFKLHHPKPLPLPNPIAELELQQAEKAWQESQQLIQSIAETSTSILYLCDATTHTLLYANPQLEKILGYTLAEFQTFEPICCQHIVHSDDYPGFERHRTRSRHLQEGEIAEGEYRFRAKDGSWRWLLLRETVLSQQEGMGIQGTLCGTATDITRLKHAELALERANQELTRISITDALTHLANRRRMGDFLETLWQKPQIEYRPVAVILCDIDYFKLYNDAYGHLAGDRCLQQVSRVLRYSILRSIDLVARYGGEEFAIILPKTNVAGAKIVADRIRVGIADLQIPHQYSQVSDQLTVSMGIAIAPPLTQQTPIDLIDLADRALYRAKAEGRDRYCVTIP